MFIKFWCQVITGETCNTCNEGTYIMYVIMLALKSAKLHNILPISNSSSASGTNITRTELFHTL